MMHVVHDVVHVVHDMMHVMHDMTMVAAATWRRGGAMLGAT